MINDSTNGKICSLFTGLGDEAMAEVSSCLEEASFDREDYIFFPGDPASDICLVEEGLVKIGQISDEGKEFTLNIAGPGEVFGEMCIIEGGAREHCAKALTSLKVKSLKRSRFMALAEKHPALMSNMLKIIGNRRRQLETKMADMVFKGVSERLVSFLLELQEQGRDNPIGQSEASIRFTHQELANIIGSTRETTTIALNRLKRSGLVSLKKKNIIIHDRDRLLQLAT